MPWTRSGDTAATYPALMQLQGSEGADDRLLNELFGFVWRCSCQSAAHSTDYVIDAGTAYMLGGARTPVLIALLEQVEIFIPTTIKGGKAWKILQDPDFIHIRLKDEVERERRQRQDTRPENTRVLVPVRLRDGDNCRWCGLGVEWRGRKSNRSAELDHLVPGEVGTIDTMVVACRACNGARKDNVETWAATHELRDPPVRPNYGTATAEYLTKNGYPTDPNTDSDGSAPALAAAADPAPRPGVRPAAPERGRQRQAPREELARKSAPNSIPDSVGTRSAGSGREGSVPQLPQGSARETPAAHPAPSDPARPRPSRRGRRGGRSRTPRTTGDS